MLKLQTDSMMKEINYKKYGKLLVQFFSPRLSKKVVDKIDVALGQYYGFSDEELEFIINYDIKYRMGI